MCKMVYDNMLITYFTYITHRHYLQAPLMCCLPIQNGINIHKFSIKLLPTKTNKKPKLFFKLFSSNLHYTNYSAQRIKEEQADLKRKQKLK